MGRTLLLLAVLLGVIAACAQTAQPVSAFDQQMIDHQKQMLQAMQQKNGAALRQMVAEDFQGISTNGDFYEKSEVFDDGLAKDTISYGFRVIKLNDDSAIVSYNLVVPGGHPRYRHMADTWARADGTWKLKFQQVTPNLWSANDFD